MLLHELLAIPPLRGKYLTVLADNCCYYFYMLHDAFFFNCIRHSFKIGIYTLITPSLTKAQVLMGRGMLARYKIRGMPEPNDSTHATHCPLHRSSTSSILRYRVMHAAFLWAYRR